jgi:DNA-binding XRE family transcriptional regulator
MGLVIAFPFGMGFNTESISTGPGSLSIPLVSIRQIKAARALVGMSQADLAEKSGISLPTIKRLESEGGEVGGRPKTAQALVAALEAAGVIFLPENGHGPGVAIRKLP